MKVLDYRNSVSTRAARQRAWRSLVVNGLGVVITLPLVLFFGGWALGSVLEWNGGHPLTQSGGLIWIVLCLPFLWMCFIGCRRIVEAIRILRELR